MPYQKVNAVEKDVQKNMVESINKLSSKRQEWKTRSLKWRTRKFILFFKHWKGTQDTNNMDEWCNNAYCMLMKIKI